MAKRDAVLWCIMLLYIFGTGDMAEIENNDSEMISVNEGLARKKIGYVAKAEAEEYINILIRLPTLNMHYFPPGTDTGIYKTIYDSYKLMQSDYKQFMDSRKTTLNAYLGTFSGRNKRSILAFLGGSILGAAFSGLTEYQIIKINSHLKKTKSEVKAISSKLDSVVTHEILFEKNNRAI